MAEKNRKIPFSLRHIFVFAVSGDTGLMTSSADHRIRFYFVTVTKIDGQFFELPELVSKVTTLILEY